MCGISAIVKKNPGVFGFLYNSLEQLQNRGYDSAGICGVRSSDKSFVVRKCISDEKSNALEKLAATISYGDDDCMIGIAHTRWATHGIVSAENAHPHVCYRNKIALVHNGIIDNYATLRSELESKGVRFKGQTDSEVVVNLISYFNTQCPLYKAIKKALKMLEGTWAFAIISTDCDKLYFTRHGSPLLLVQTQNEVIITSEMAGLITKDCMYQQYTPVPENQLYMMSASCTIDCDMKALHYSPSDVSCYPFPHWMLKEINEQADVIKRTVVFGSRVRADGSVRLGGLESHRDVLKHCTDLVIVGCGTSYHAGLIGKYFFSKYCPHLNVSCINAAEFDDTTIHMHKRGNTAAIMVSQSGETRDVMRALEICNGQGVITVGVVNVVESSIARDTTCGVYCHAGREVAVASTKSFTSQVLVLVMIMLWYMDGHEPLATALHEFMKLTPAVLHKLQNTIDYERILQLINHKPSMFILGSSGADAAIALESALKFKEITYVHCEGTYTSGLKHGPLALITNEFPVICLVSNDTDYAQVNTATEEIQCRNGRSILIGNHPSADILIDQPSPFVFLWNNMALQLLSYHLAVRKGINPDMPRNLAKVVTVA